MNAEKQEIIGDDRDCHTDCRCEVMKPANKEEMFVDCNRRFDKYICDEESGNQDMTG